jgi:signal transduction histidine kinase
MRASRLGYYRPVGWSCVVDGSLGRSRDSRRIGATLVTVILVAGALAVAEGALAYREGSPGLWILCALTAAFVLALVPAWALARRERNSAAVFVACSAIFAIQATYVTVYPRAYPAIAIASIVVVSLALSFVRGRRLFALVLVSWAVAMAAVLIGVLGTSRVTIPESASVTILLGSGAAAVTVGMVLLWQFARDMTEALAQSQQAHEELTKAHEQLREQERAKTRFINAAAHELNTPLTPVLLQLHVLRNAVSDPQQLRRVEVLERNLERMKGLVHEMLDVARLQAGRLALRPVDFDLRDAMQAAVDDFAGVAQQRGVALALATGAPLPVHADRRRVDQVLSNLVSNAVRLTPAGGRVDVSAEAGPAGTTVDVRDTGVGLTASQVTALFQPFSRVHDEVTSGAGSGLGLYISQGLMHEMGGRLSVASAGPGKGATFSAFLPSAGAPAGPVPSVSAAA